MPLCIWFSWTLSSPTLTLLVGRRVVAVVRGFAAPPENADPIPGGIVREKSGAVVVEVADRPT